MKLRITQKDLDELSLEQKQNLCDLWIPNIYDPAVATVCVDAAEDKYQQITFVVGGLKLLKHHDILLYDMKFLPDEAAKVQEEENPESVPQMDADDGNADEEFVFDEDFSFEFQRPETFSKQESLPLLDIGQMIDILERKNYGQCDFSLSITFGDYVCDMGKDAFSGSNFDANNKNSELCDILWEAVKALL